MTPRSSSLVAWYQKEANNQTEARVDFSVAFHCWKRLKRIMFPFFFDVTSCAFFACTYCNICQIAHTSASINSNHIHALVICYGLKQSFKDLPARFSALSQTAVICMLACFSPTALPQTLKHLSRALAAFPHEPILQSIPHYSKTGELWCSSWTAGLNSGI